MRAQRIAIGRARRSGVIFGSLKDDWDQSDTPPPGPGRPAGGPPEHLDPLAGEHADWYAPEDESALRTFLFKYLPILFLCLIAFWPAWRGGDFLWQDDVHVTQLPPLRSAPGLWSLWKNPTVNPDWAPLSYTLLWPQHLLWQVKVPMGYHLVSLFVHTFNAFLVWMLLRRLDVPCALAAAMLFALHPLQIEPAAWIARQPVVWGALFGLAFVLVYLRYAQADNVVVDPSRIVRLPETPWLLYTFAMVTYLLAGLSQPLLVCTLPLVAGLVAWWKRDDFGRRDLLKLLPFVLIGAAMAATHFWVELRQQDQGRVYLRPFSGWETLFVPVRAVLYYLTKFVLPTDLSVVYQPWTIHPRNVLLWLALVSVVVIGVALWAKRRDIGRAPVAAFAAYLLLLLPLVTPLNRAQMGDGFVANRFAYLATIVPAAIVLAIVGVLLRRIPRQTRLWVAPVAGSVFGIALMVFANAGQARSFKSSLAMWENAVAASDGQNTTALIRRGKAYQAADDLTKAFTDFEEVDRQSGFRNVEAKIALGEIAETYDLKYATWCYQQALAVAPDKPEPYRKLGAVLVRQKQYAKAAEIYQDGLDRFPNDVDLLRLMGMAMAYQNKADAANNYFEKAIATDPRFLPARLDYARVLGAQKKYQEAFQQYNEAIKIDPRSFEAFMGAGGMLFQLGGYEQSYNCFRTALYYRPDDVEARFGAGLAAAKHAQLYWYKGDQALAQAKIKEATAFLKRVTELKKDSNIAKSALEQATALATEIEKGPPKNRPTTRSAEPTTREG